MKKLLYPLFLILPIALFAQAPAETYPEDPASVVHAGVPKGELIRVKFNSSKIYPGTSRTYTIYVPAQYNPAKPACVFVDQDGVQFKSTTVFDNLINSKEMPVIIGVYITPGQVPANDDHSLDRYNRSYEYDGLGDNYAKFILNEILPDVEKHKTSDGRAIHLSTKANDRAIAGSSSGAIAAFTAAWENPEAFSRVFSAIGTYVGLRGGDSYPAIIRKYEAKPIRIFLQDGANDKNTYGGDWFYANQMMARSLEFAGYEVNHVWGQGGHDSKHGTAIFAQAMRWLWKDYPKPVGTSPSKNQMLAEIIAPGQGWELVGKDYGFTEGIIANAKGEVFFQDIPNSKTYKIGLDGKISLVKTDAERVTGTAYGPDGMRYTSSTKSKKLSVDDGSGKTRVLDEKLNGNDLVIANNGNMYISEPNGNESPGKIYLVKQGQPKMVVDIGIKYPNGLAFTPDQTQMYVAESTSHWIWAFQIKKDGTLDYKQRFGRLYAPDTAENAWPDGLKCDTAGRIYVATRMGIQVLDQVGRVNAILPVPMGQPSNLCFGGPNFDIMYVTVQDKVYSRKLKTRGANTFEPPIKPAKPKL